MFKILRWVKSFPKVEIGVDNLFPKVCNWLILRTANYVKTLDVEYDMPECIYGKIHHCLFMTFNDEIQFGYLELDSLI